MSETEHATSPEPSATPAATNRPWWKLQLHDDDVDPRFFWPSAAIGVIGVLYGLVRWAPWDSSLGLDPYIRWTVGLAVVHDLAFAPLVGVVGLLVARAVPDPIKAPVQGGLIVAAIVTLFSWPFVRGWGRLRSNESLLPRNYAQGLVILLVLIAIGTLVASVVSWRRHRRAVGVTS